MYLFSVHILVTILIASESELNPADVNLHFDLDSNNPEIAASFSTYLSESSTGSTYVAEEEYLTEMPANACRRPDSISAKQNDLRPLVLQDLQKLWGENGLHLKFYKIRDEHLIGFGLVASMAGLALSARPVMFTMLGLSMVLPGACNMQDITNGWLHNYILKDEDRTDTIVKVILMMLDQAFRHLPDDRRIHMVSLFDPEIDALREWVIGLDDSRTEIFRMAPMFIYTTDAYYAGINEAISLDSTDNEKFTKYEGLISLLCDSIVKMHRASNDAFVGRSRRCGGQPVWRGMSYINVQDEVEGSPKGLLEKYREHMRSRRSFMWPGFVSTSLSRIQALKFTGKDEGPPMPWRQTCFVQNENAILFKIIVVHSKLETLSNKNQIAVRMKRASRYAEEDEVLFYPYSKFWVTDVSQEEGLEPGMLLPVVTLITYGRCLPLSRHNSFSPETDNAM